MIPDDRTNIVYVSDLLDDRHPELARALTGILEAQGIPVRRIVGTKDIWCRDFLPSQIDLGEFVRFRYAPDYLDGCEHLITVAGDLGPIAELANCVDSAIVLDGGNLVRWADRCILTRKVFRENPGVGHAALLGTLREQLGVEDLIVIPEEPGDDVGHADGVVRFLDGGTVLVNNYSKVAPSYRGRLLAVLRRAGLHYVEIPYVPREGRRGEIPPAFGNYVNFLQVRGLVVLPSYGIPEDDLARRIVAGRLPDSEVVPLACADLSMEGGVLNCMTWNILG